ncbi:MAG: uracil phosphoribosyltransferase [Atopobiaceae bacterium]|nr:uracil phosphoribosyltransferase [Atopobiaceae bacterium]
MSEVEDLTTDGRVTLVDHPMVQHKLGILRSKDTGIKQFRELVRELALFEGYEATRDFPLEDVEVNTPLETCTCKELAGKKVAVVPILRAGLGMVDGILDLIPSARVGHIGMYRDPDTHEPHEYYCKLPPDVSNRTCLIVDPMLATGGSATAAIDYLRKAGVRDIRLLVLVAVPEGIRAVLDFDPDVRVYTCAIDRQLNESAYILPGLGDAGDRIFGTK